jgi:hypothetical protein
MDGEVATSAFESGSPANEQEATQFQVGANETISAESAEESAVQERLEDLGYL